MKRSPGKIPVTIVTGFLGAGKTTLLNRLIGSGRKLAFIVNELGSVGIDGDLVADASDSVLELPNGCLCCAVRGDLPRVVMELHKSGKPFEQLIVETTGIADPAPVAESFAFDPILNRMHTVDGIVTVVDAVNFLDELAKEPQAERQVAFADLLLLNKCDDAGEVISGAVEGTLRSLNPFAPVLRCQRSDIDPLLALDLGGSRFTSDGLHPSLEIPAGLRHGHPVRHAALCLDLPGEVDHARFRGWLGHVLFDLAGKVIRMKGIVAVHDQPERLIFQSVHRLFEDGRGAIWKDGEERRCRVVLIGENLDEAELKRGFIECLIQG